MARNTFHDRIAPWLLIALHLSLLAFSSTRHNPTIDETAHVVAGLSNWRFGRFDLYHVNPPLARMCAALPLLFSGCREAWTVPQLYSRPEFDLGRQFLVANEGDAVRYFVVARWALIPFSITGGLACWLWARRLYGREAGTVALCLWCFSPNVLAYGQLVTPDAAAASLGVAAWYGFWRWLKSPSWEAAGIASVALGLAELAKMTWLILFAVWPVVWLAYRLSAMTKGEAIGVLRGQATQLVILLIGAVAIINAAYAFEGSFTRLDEFDFKSAALTSTKSGGKPAAPLNRFGGRWLGRLPVPLPANYVMGIDTQRRDFDQKLWSYLRGCWRQGGWWYYYLYALAIKVPLGSWCLLATAMAFTACSREPAHQRRDEMRLLAPAAIVIVLVSAHTGFNHHVRYVLPAFPFAMIFASKLARIARRRRTLRIFTAVALTSSAVSTLCCYPHCLSYFNEVIGGPRRAHAHLLNSNLDWGQDLLFLKRWLDCRADIELRGFAYEYENILNPKLLGIDAPKPPVDPRWVQLAAASEPVIGPRPGWYAVGVSRLCERKHMFDYFNEFEPAAYAGYSIRIYCLANPEVNHVRRKLGLQPLAEGPAQ